ncbi:RDD family protein [Longimicrobium sp.]|uniref:RDD family protein n=1 Tax=Longimicrobium sp. TaxID=2029185 RepID=UPI002C7E9B9B|nr:RDD family protein [Longimicrobium sp.]HSU17522.1 RDD family protein [Longimicrobium sp.]
MALISCPACTGKLSSSAPSCPHCGHPGPFAEVPAPSWSETPAYSSPAQPSARYENAAAGGGYGPPEASAFAPAAYAPAPAAPQELECPLCRVRHVNRTFCPRCEERLVQPRFLAPHRFPRVPVDYSTFNQRLAAYLLDALVLLPVTALVWWLQTRTPAGLAIGATIGLIVPNLYDIVLTATTGQTVGKRLAEIQVRRADGGKVGWGTAFVRRLPVLLVGFVAFLGMLVVAATLTQPDFDGAYSVWDGLKLLRGATPLWARLLNVLFGFYSLADIITFFANSRHRALHDYIAGTVVIYK